MGRYEVTFKGAEGVSPPPLLALAQDVAALAGVINQYMRPYVVLAAVNRLEHGEDFDWFVHIFIRADNLSGVVQFLDVDWEFAIRKIGQ